MTDEERATKRFEIAVQIRNFEIELFWKRSIFFWGFISAAFVGFAALHEKNPDLGIVVACFGMVCSCAWTLLNRGSKYWQESWEKKVENAELDVTGPFFAKEEAVQEKGWWLRARKFSVSKLAIALSDYVFFLWLFLVVAELLRRYAPLCFASSRSFGLGVFVALSFTYVLLLCCRGQKSPR